MINKFIVQGRISRDPQIKGTPAVFEGYTSSGSYEKDGKKIFTQDMIVSKIYFFENKELNSKESKNEDFDTLLFN